MATEAGAVRRRSAAVAALLLGATLLIMAVPQLVAAVLSLDARAVLWEFEDDKTPEPARVASAVAGLATAADWLGDGQAAIDRSFLLLCQGDAARAEAAVVAGLARAPGQPSAWARLARLRLARGDQDGAAAALRLSLLSGAVVPSLMAWRLDLGLRLRPGLDADMLALLERQVRLTWILAPDHVAASAEPFVRQALDALSQRDLDQRRRLVR